MCDVSVVFKYSASVLLWLIAVYSCILCQYLSHMTSISEIISIFQDDRILYRICNETAMCIFGIVCS